MPSLGGVFGRIVSQEGYHSLLHLYKRRVAKDPSVDVFILEDTRMRMKGQDIPFRCTLVKCRIEEDAYDYEIFASCPEFLNSHYVKSSDYWRFLLREDMWDDYPIPKDVLQEILTYEAVLKL